MKRFACIDLSDGGDLLYGYRIHPLDEAGCKELIPVTMLEALSSSAEDWDTILTKMTWHNPTDETTELFIPGCPLRNNDLQGLFLTLPDQMRDQFHRLLRWLRDTGKMDVLFLHLPHPAVETRLLKGVREGLKKFLNE